jgi:sulfite exporter TauE/SafE/copper chaperone CopZ
MLKKLKLKINGVHCKSCKALIETEIDVLPGVNRVNVDYISGKAEIEFDNEKISQEKILGGIRKLNYQPEIIGAGGGELSGGQEKNSGNFWLGLLAPLLIALVAGGYFLFRRSGGFELLAKLNEGNVGYGIIFIIGLLAGFHCIGMCGGLVVAYSSSGLKNAGDKVKRFAPHLQYNLGRLLSYSVIGGILGGIGSFFGVNPIFTGIITVLAGAFMVLMGLSFIKSWRVLEAIKIRTPQFIARFLYNEKHSGKSKGPFIIGLLNGLMPCGPLQAMQLYALASGSMTRGAISMAIYALGTIPLMFIFGSTISSMSHSRIKNVIKVSGALVILLGLIMFNRGLANFGYGFRIGSASNIVQEPRNNNNNNEKYQEVKMDLTYYGYQPNTFYIKKGTPVRWVINVKQMSGCTNAIMIESLGIRKNLQYGENVIEFTPPEEVKEIKFSCGMRMVWGKFVVADNDSGGLGVKDANAADTDIVLPSGTCGMGGGCGRGAKN